MIIFLENFGGHSKKFQFRNIRKILKKKKKSSSIIPDFLSHLAVNIFCTLWYMMFSLCYYMVSDPIPTMWKHFFLMSWITPCHSDEYSSRFFSCHPRYWNKSGCMFLKFQRDIKQFHRNIKHFHCSIKEIENTTMEFHHSIKEMENITMEFHRSIKKPSSAPYVAFLAGTTPSMYFLAGILHDPQKKNCLTMFQILKLGNWIFMLFRDSPI